MTHIMFIVTAQWKLMDYFKHIILYGKHLIFVMTVETLFLLTQIPLALAVSLNTLVNLKYDFNIITVDCNPGEYRDLAGICHFCPDGTFSASSSLFCEACSPGTSATKNLYYKYWDSFDNGLSTNCNYFCGTP